MRPYLIENSASRKWRPGSPPPSARLLSLCNLPLKTKVIICLLTVERDASGTFLPKIKCLKCTDGSTPSEDKSVCVPCLPNPILRDGTAENWCNCSTTTSNLCIPNNLGIGLVYIPSSRDDRIKYGEKEIVSKFFKDNVKNSAYLCYEHKNVTACQLLGNLCTLAIHDKDHPSCSAIYSLSVRDRNQKAPHLFFSESHSNSIHKEEDITNVYRLRGGENDRLDMTVVEYDLYGRMRRFTEHIPGNMFQMCNGSYLEFDAAFNFGTKYSKKCKIPALQLWSGMGEKANIFYDLFVPYNTSQESKLFAIPMLIKNLKNNQNEEPYTWSLTTRFFLVDTVGGISVSSNGKPEVIRYLSKMELRIKMLNTREFPKKAGKIFPPLAIIEYGILTEEELEAGKEIEFEFLVTYEMENRESKKEVEISVGVLSAVAVFWSAMETWSWSRRSGKLAIDPFTLAKFLVFTCGNLAHVFLAVIYFASLHWLIFFKQQTYIHVILPTPDQEKIIRDFVITIFSLKIVDIIHLINNQISVDVFLLDWEKPSQCVGVKNATKEMAISVWRTYLVANEWNELQTRRKINLSLQIILVVLILRVFGVENIATADPHNSFNIEGDGYYHSDFSYVCRFALGVSIYGAVAILQVIFWCGIYTSVVEDKLEQFTDICSLANISIFAMAQNNFGYYIHGKSAHGFSDTDMATLLEQLQRESDDLCGHRGLQPGSDHQTFSMSLPSKLRNYYDKVVIPATQMGTESSSSGGGPRVQRLTGAAVDHMVQAYSTMNKFLTRFLEHALRDLDYEVRDKLFLESVLDAEFQDATSADKAIFYAEKGSCFSALLLYGHEFSLTIFDMMIFCFVDLFAEDFLLSGIVTYFTAKSVIFVRYILGRKNLAKKTLIDKRFLV